VNPPVIHLVAAYEDVPREECMIPERCITAVCGRCGRDCHFDPRHGNPEVLRIMCKPCLEAVLPF
jgi:hypothetical protein